MNRERLTLAGRRQRESTLAKRTVLYQQLCELAAMLPGVKCATIRGYRVLKIQDRILARLRMEADGTLELKMDFTRRRDLMRRNPRAFFVTTDCLHYETVFVRLELLHPQVFKELLGHAWR